MYTPFGVTIYKSVAALPERSLQLHFSEFNFNDDKRTLTLCHIGLFVGKSFLVPFWLKVSYVLKIDYSFFVSKTTVSYLIQLIQICIWAQDSQPMVLKGIYCGYCHIKANPHFCYFSFGDT